ncbi:MAG: serine hydrolase [Spirochaetales bacterium]|nr:serine hydrolase [Spirochaetales bacterium]
MSKSLSSALVGIALDEGYIKSVEEPITNYIPEFKAEGFDKITIKHLLTMSSGFRHTWGNAPWNDSARAYYSTDIRKLALSSRIIEGAGKHFNYNSCNTQLLGIILERVTGRTVSEYMEEKIWKPLGMEYSASWSMDSERSGFELVAAGLNARAIDFARIGRLFLNKGLWEGKRLISEKWIIESTTIDSVSSVMGIENYYPTDEKNPFYKFFNLDDGYYSYSWYGYPREDDDYDFFALGILGQFIYVSPQKKLIIVRCGKEWGEVDWWPEIFRTMADNI